MANRWSNEPILCKYALKTNSIITYVNYRLAPEYKHPTAVYDCYDCQKFLLEHKADFHIDEKQIILMGDSAGGDVIVTLCGGCSDELIDADVPAEHIVQFLHRHMDRLPRFDSPVRVGLEPGCSVMKHADLMREVVEAMGCEVVNTTMGCCGKNTPVSNPLMDERERECEGADWIVVACPMCLVKFDAQPEGIPAVHVSELVAMAAGDGRSLEYHRIQK